MKITIGDLQNIGKFRNFVESGVIRHIKNGYYYNITESGDINIFSRIARRNSSYDIEPVSLSAMLIDLSEYMSPQVWNSFEGIAKALNLPSVLVERALKMDKAMAAYATRT